MGRKIFVQDLHGNPRDSPFDRTTGTRLILNNIGSGELERNVTWDGQLNLCTRGRTTGDL